MLRCDSYRYDSRIVFDAISLQKYIFRLGNKRVENLLRSTVTHAWLISSACRHTHRWLSRVYAHKNSFCMHSTSFLCNIYNNYFIIFAQSSLSRIAALYIRYMGWWKKWVRVRWTIACASDLLFFYMYVHIRGRVRRNQSIFLVFRWTFCP